MGGNIVHPQTTETQRLGKTIVRWKAMRAKQSLLSYQDPVCVAWGNWANFRIHDEREGRGARWWQRERERGRVGCWWVERALLGVAGGGGGAGAGAREIVE